MTYCSEQRENEESSEYRAEQIPQGYYEGIPETKTAVG